VGTPDVLSVAFRAVSFVLLLQAAGTALFLAVFERSLPAGCRTLDATRRLGRWVAIVAVVFVTAHYLMEAARMAGEMSGIIDPAMQMMALQSPTGSAFGMRTLGLVLIAFALRGRATRALTSLPGILLAIAAFTLTGHTSDNSHRGGAALLLAVHLLVVAFWLGALAPLYMSTTREPPAVSAKLIDAFSTVATWAVPGIAIAGIVLCFLLIPTLAAFNQPYGQLLLTKVGLFAVLIGMATFNKWIFGPACADEADPHAARAFRRTVALEYALICAVLAVTAVMTTFYSPEAA
jgi:putative copper export protein